MRGGTNGYVLCTEILLVDIWLHGAALPAAHTLPAPGKSCLIEKSNEIETSYCGKGFNCKKRKVSISIYITDEVGKLIRGYPGCQRFTSSMN